MECIGTGAVFFICIVEGVDTRGGVIVVVPNVGVAGILEEALVCAVVDSQI